VANFPKVERHIFDEAKTLQAEKRVMLKCGDVYLMASHSATCNADEMRQMYLQLERFTYRSWDEYVAIRKSLYIIRPFNIIPHLYFCSCFSGAKKRPCKHSVMIMQFVTKTLVSPYVSTPIQSKRKRGRPAKHGKALEFE
jgi:hypothetical protein